jgi:hypothetical protein
MTYYIEYTVPAEGGAADLPLNEKESGGTVPLTELAATEHVRTDALPARSAVLGATLEEAKQAAEQVISHSSAAQADLYDDPSDSLEAGRGQLVASYEEGAGWSDR